MDTLLTLLGVAGVNYIMGVPGADDVMLAYQSTSFHDALYLRENLGLRPAPEFEAWLLSRGIFDAPTRVALPGARAALPNFVAALPPHAESEAAAVPEPNR
jgi:ethanolamine ammonia-lyase large subunit